MTPTKVPGGYEYRGHRIERVTRGYYGRKRGKARRNAMGMIYRKVFVVDPGGVLDWDGAAGASFERLRDAVAWIDNKETA
jgi:hypothetical protein